MSERPIFQYEYGFRLKYSESYYRWELSDPNGNVVYYCETAGNPTAGEWQTEHYLDGGTPPTVKAYQS